MTRRRYISTAISTDEALANLALGGYLAPLLFLMAIPHADEAGHLTGKASEFRLLVCPGFPSTTEQVDKALNEITDMGLWSRNGTGINFKPASWRRIQSYISDARFEAAQNPAEHRTSPQNTANQRKVAQNTASSKVGLGVESKVESKVTTPPPATPPDNSNRKGVTDLLACFTPSELDALKQRFPGVDLQWEGGKCLDWWALKKSPMKRPKLAFKNWLEKAKAGGQRVSPPAGEPSKELTYEEEVRQWV